MPKEVSYFYDIVCPFAYLGSTRIRAICDAAGAKLRWRPMLLGGVYRAIGNADYPKVPANRVRGNAVDLDRWAQRRGVELRFPAGHPRRTVETMRLLCAAELQGDEARLEALTHALYRAYWVDGEDVTDRAVLARIGAAHGVPIESIDRDDVKARLRASTDEAVQAGGFGAPTMIVDDGAGHRKLFFGQDRLLFIEHALGLPRPVSARPPALAPTGKELVFLFDYSSPYTYLASTQIERVAAERGARLVWKPVFLGGLFKEIGNPLVPIMEASEQRRAYLFRDLADWSEWWSVPFKWPSRFPMMTVTALRMTLALPPAEVARFAHAVFRAFWVDDRDINDKAELVTIAASLGLDGAALLAQANDPAIKQKLVDDTAQAARDGAFGLPTFFVGSELFFGQDRLDHLADAL